MSNQYFSDRAVGQYPLSIATSLALEAAAGIHEDFKVDKAPLLEYPELWFNMRTLYRNFMDALDNQDHNSVSVEAIAATLCQEMEQLESIVKDVSPNTKVVWYTCNYNGLERYKHATVRMDTTDKQKTWTRLLKGSLGLILKEDGQDGPIKVFDLKIKATNQPKAMIVSHYAYDLLSASEFSELVLLESHTGKIKPRGEWYTKYLNGKELAQIPFNEGFLQIFGDKETFRPGDIRFRRAILEIAEKYKWTQTSTKEKLSYGIDQLKNPYYKEVLRKIVN